MDRTATDAAERATRAAAERLSAAAAGLTERMSESSAGNSPAMDGYLDAIEAAVKSAQEYARALVRLRDVLRPRLGR
jgi:hypothetical protein